MRIRFGFQMRVLFGLQCQRVRGVAGVDAVRLQRQGQLSAQDPPAHAGAALPQDGLKVAQLRKHITLFLFAS